MLDAPIFPYASVSIAFPTQENQHVDIPLITQMVSGRYFPPQVVPGGDGSSSLLMVSEHGHSLINISPNEAVLSVNFSNEWLKSLEKGFEYIENRLRLFVSVLERIIPLGPFIYGSAVSVARINSDGLTPLAPLVSTVTGLDGPKYAKDILVRQTFDYGESAYLNLTTQTLRNWDNKLVSTPFVRLPDVASDSASIEILAEVNSRRAHNESIDVNVNEVHLRTLLSQSQEILRTACRKYEEQQKWDTLDN